MYSEQLGVGHDGNGDLTGSRDESPLAALFHCGSKVAHSSLPNATYCSTQQGCLTYTAIREIGEGEMVTFAYINSLWERSTPERRTKLLTYKHFICIGAL